MHRHRRSGLLLAAAFAAVFAFTGTPAPAEAGQRMFVHADDSAHKRALVAIASGGLRHEFISPGNELIFSAELSRGQIRAMERLGARIEAVPLARPMTQGRRYGALRRRATPAGKPDCQADPSHPKCAPKDDGGGTAGRACAPQDQREYQTLLLSGADAGVDAGTGVRLLVIDTGVNVDHPDLDVAFCRNATGRRIKNNCKDDIGHGTHVAGSAAATGGADGLGLFGTAPGATLGVEKICGSQLCFVDDMIRGIEDGVQNFAPDVISMSFGAPDGTALRNAIADAVASGALFLVSAGNGGPGADTISYPASDANVVAVGSLDAARIATRMSARGGDDGDDSSVAVGEVEVAGAGFVIESTSMGGCYQVMSGTSMAAPSMAGFAAASWQGTSAATRALLRADAADIDNSAALGGYDDTGLGFDAATGYGMPRNAFAIDGAIAAQVAAAQATVSAGETVGIQISGPADAAYRIGISSPSGDWTYGAFTTDGSGASALTLTPWTDPGTWLLSVDFGGGAADFGAAYDVFEQAGAVASSQ